MNDKPIVPIFDLETIEVPELNNMLINALESTRVDLSDLTTMQRKILVALQGPDFYFLTQEQMANTLKMSTSSISRAFADSNFLKVYHYMQTCMMLTHLPEIDNQTLKMAKSDDGCFKDRELAYVRMGVFDGKKGGLTVQIGINNNVPGGAPGGNQQLCPADDLVKRFQGSPLGEDKPGGKTTIIQTPDKN